ncbi:MAG TPA: Gfo/Idh/MocA family oxidoreductase [Gemmataceae bacterium]|nr:Gfo/Idh/MocA family oxidoreductase [Gemmataceae bacterium]
MSRPVRFTRRQFIQSATAAGFAGPLILTSTTSLRAAPSDRINLGFIGVGTQGGGHVGGFLGRGDVQIVAICDVVKNLREAHAKRVEERYAKNKKDGTYKGCKTYTDFRELLQHPGLDAVLIATPDHWHAIPCIEAAKAKKDIYCEKPLTHSIVQGRKIVEAVAQNKVIFQTGSQQRSEFGGHFRKAVEYIRSGRIGKIKTIHIGDGVGDPPIACDLPDQPTPEGTDWEMWLGPAPKRGYHADLCPTAVRRGFPVWRRYLEYSGGYLADMGAHHFDIAQWALNMDNSGPVKIEPPKDQKAKRGLRFVYANGVEMIHAASGTPDCSFIGTDGIINATRGGISSKPESILKEPLGDKDYHVYPSSNHHANWIECIKSRKDTICTAEIGHRSATICHLANIGYGLRRNLVWDPEKESFVHDDEANKLVDHAMREPWRL